MQPATLPETTHYRGDRWTDGHRHFGPVLVDGVAPADPCLYCRVQFRQRKTGVFGYELNSAPVAGQGQITITDGAAYVFDLPSQELPLAVGSWDWDFETYTTADHSDLPWTIWRGSIKIIEDVSHD